MNYALAETKQLIVDSDGYLHQPPFFIMFSGLPTTHVQNSDERVAIGLWDSEIFKGMDVEQCKKMAKFLSYTLDLNLCSTNGDDYQGVVNDKVRDGTTRSQKLGFVYTDISISPPIVRRPVVGTNRYRIPTLVLPDIRFSSQVFLSPRLRQIRDIRRVPDGTSKSFYNVVCNDDFITYLDFVKHVKDLPYAESLLELARLLRSYEKRARESATKVARLGDQN